MSGTQRFSETLSLMWHMMPLILMVVIPSAIVIAFLLSLINTNTVKVKDKEYAVPNKGFNGWLIWLYDLMSIFGGPILGMIIGLKIGGVWGGILGMILGGLIGVLATWFIGLRPIKIRLFFNDSEGMSHAWSNYDLITSVKMNGFSTLGNVTLHRRGLIHRLTGFNFLYNNGTIGEVVTEGKQKGRLTNQSQIGRIVYDGPMVAHKGATHISEVAVQSLIAKKSFFGDNIFVMDDALFDGCIFADGVEIFYSGKPPVFKKTAVMPKATLVIIDSNVCQIFEEIAKDGIVAIFGDDVAQVTVTTTRNDVEDLPPPPTEEFGWVDITTEFDPTNEELAELVGEELTVTSATDQTAKAEAIAEVVSVLSEVIVDKETAPGSEEQKVAAVATLAATLNEVADDKATAPEVVVPGIQPNPYAQDNEDLQRIVRMEHTVHKMTLEVELLRQQHAECLTDNKRLEKELRDRRKDRAELEELRGEKQMKQEREKALRLKIRQLEDQLDTLAEKLAAEKVAS